MMMSRLQVMTLSNKFTPLAKMDAINIAEICAQLHANPQKHKVSNGLTEAEAAAFAALKKAEEHRSSLRARLVFEWPPQPLRPVMLHPKEDTVHPPAPQTDRQTVVFGSGPAPPTDASAPLRLRTRALAGARPSAHR